MDYVGLDGMVLETGWVWYAPNVKSGFRVFGI